MKRKFLGWSGWKRASHSVRRTRAARPRRKSGLGDTLLGVERLEGRWMLAAGALDITFNPTNPTPALRGTLIANLGFIEEGHSVAVQADGKILVAGTVQLDSLNSDSRDFGVARFLSNGTLDTTFGIGGVDGVNGLATVDFNGKPDQSFEMIIDTGGNILLVGSATNTSGVNGGMAIARFDTNGVLDSSFGTGGKVFQNLSLFGFNTVEARSVALQSDGKIVVAGSARTSTNATFNFLVARFTTNGSLDTLSGFGGGTGFVTTDFNSGRDQGFGLAIQSDGKIVVGGSATTSPGVVELALVRYDSSGNLDTTFDVDGRAVANVTGLGPGDSDQIENVAIESGGKIVVAGQTFSADFADAVLARFNTNGSLDTTFNSSGAQPGINRIDINTRDFFEGLVIQSNGDYVAAGTSNIVTGVFPSPVTNNEQLLVARVLASTGQLDPAFGTGGLTITNLTAGNVVERHRDVALQPDGKIVAGGLYNNLDFVLARYESGAAAPPVADAGGPYTLNEPGGSVVLDASGTTGAGPLVYEWDLDGDNIFGETGAGALRGDETGINPTFTATGLDGPSSIVVSLRVTNTSTLQTGTDTATINVLNVDPTADDAMFFLPENSPNGTVVGTVAADDAGDDALSFSIVGGTGAGAFSIGANTGEITVSNSALLDFETSPTLSLEVEVSDGDGGVDTATITINLLNQPSISGVVFVDVNQNGQYDANEPGIDGVLVELLDEFGNPALDEFGDAITAVTSSGGFYLFEDLDPGTYQLFEHQPTGVNDGAEEIGSLGGTIVANDRIQLTLAATDAFDYAFAELGQQVTSGDAATIGFWQNKHGQALITQGGAPLAAWLTTNFPNIFGNTFTGVNANGGAVASFYRDQVFKQTGKKSAGPAKVDAQFMAVALATYFTSQNLAGNLATSYGFNVTDTGIGTKIVNVGNKGAAFGVANGASLTILQLLQATNDLTDQFDSQLGFAAIYDTNGDGLISSAEANLRTMANDVFSSINEGGGI